jgi:glycosyltransferase involved in cell wall biosynthesis
MTSLTKFSSQGRVLLVTNELQSSPSGGRQLLCKLNFEILKSLYGDRLVLFELPRGVIYGKKSIISTFRGNIDGLTDDRIISAIRIIEFEKIKQVFVDGSNLGEIVKSIKRALPNVQISTFFHNVEVRFFLGALRQFKTMRALAVLIVNYLAERKSVYYSDKLICLSERDSVLMRRIYGHGATHVSPMALEDKLPINVEHFERPCEKFLLFVGGDFYANRAGILWFVNHVAPRIKIKIYIVGRGFEDLKTKLEINEKIQVVGSVDSLTTWYLGSYLVIAPIFDGSGMKTKVAEALMHGKKVIGSPEAFSGYNDVVQYAGWECVTANDFVAAIECSLDMDLKPFDPLLRRIYEDQYSFDAAKVRFMDIMNAEIRISSLDNSSGVK